MKKYHTNLSKGRYLPDTEVFTSDSNLPQAIAHNLNIRTAHHDMILPCRMNLQPVNAAISAKASFDLAANKTVQNQLLISRDSTEQIVQLIWLYLAKEEERDDEQIKHELNYPFVAFIDGSGCCSGFTLDMLILFKKLSSQNNQSATNNN